MVKAVEPTFAHDGDLVYVPRDRVAGQLAFGEGGVRLQGLGVDYPVPWVSVFDEALVLARADAVAFMITLRREAAELRDGNREGELTWDQSQQLDAWLLAEDPLMDSHAPRVHRLVALFADLAERTFDKSQLWAAQIMFFVVFAEAWWD